MLAAERYTKADQDMIKETLLSVERDVRRKQTYFDSNTKFHLSIARASHNAVLADSVHNLVVQVRDYREQLMKMETEMPERDVAEHTAVFDAIRNRDPEKARKAMVKHIRSFADFVKQTCFEINATDHCCPVNY